MSTSSAFGMRRSKSNNLNDVEALSTAKPLVAIGTLSVTPLLTTFSLDSLAAGLVLNKIKLVFISVDFKISFSTYCEEPILNANKLNCMRKKNNGRVE